MPIINIDGIGGKLTLNQKKQLVCKLPKLASGITGIFEDAFIVLIKEMGFENIGANGRLLSDKEGNK